MAAAGAAANVLKGSSASMARACVRPTVTTRNVVRMGAVARVERAQEMTSARTTCASASPIAKARCVETTDAEEAAESAAENRVALLANVSVGCPAIST